jgi:hypothetical protein
MKQYELWQTDKRHRHSDRKASSWECWRQEDRLQETGYRKTGYRKTGYRKTGYRKTNYRKTGDRETKSS